MDFHVCPFSVAVKMSHVGGVDGKSMWEVLVIKKKQIDIQVEML